jgi:hypothetical protein
MAMKCRMLFKRVMLNFRLSLFVPTLVALNKIKNVTVGFSFRKYVRFREI